MVILRQHGIRFHLTGGVTGAAYGEPRMTQDIDIVIDPGQIKLKVDALVRSLGESDFLFDEVWISKGSHKSRRDLRAIFRAGNDVDRQAIENWAETSGYETLLAEVLGESDELE